MDSINNLKISNQNHVSFKSSEAIKPKYNRANGDATNFTMVSCNENLQKNRAKYFQFINRDYNYNGTINNKLAGFDVSEHGLLLPETRVEGQIGDKQIEYNQQTQFNFFKEKHTSKGRYGDNEFELAYENGLTAAATITGTINGEPIEIKIPNSKVPENEDVKDIITTIFAINGHKLVSIGGTFRRLQDTQWKRQETNEQMAQQAFIDSQINAFT